MIHLLTVIETTLQKYWADDAGFINLQERILALRMILEEGGEGTAQGMTAVHDCCLCIAGRNVYVKGGTGPSGTLPCRRRQLLDWLHKPRTDR